MMFKEDVKPVSRFEIQNAVNACLAKVALKRRHNIPRHLVEHTGVLNPVAKPGQAPLHVADVVAFAAKFKEAIFRL